MVFLFVQASMLQIWEFPKIRGTLFGVLIFWMLLFRVPHWDPLFSETPISTLKGSFLDNTNTMASSKAPEAGAPRHLNDTPRPGEVA